jgi:predicted O-linked N-acetylglucosamine transferase (SPINDLY family)
MSAPGRNDPCPCGSGKKYKKCCFGKAATASCSPVQTSTPDSYDLKAQLIKAPDSPFLWNGKTGDAGGMHNATNTVPPDVLLKRAVALHQSGKLEEAISVYRQTILLKPDYADAYNNLGLALQDKGDLAAAIESYRKALALNPDHGQAHSNLLLVMSFHTECTPGDYLAEARRYGNRVLAQAKPYTGWIVSPSDRGAPLRLGIVSGDLCAHPVACFLESFLMHFDPALVELVAYSTNPREDVFTARIKPRFSAWNSIAGLSDEAAARKIHGDGIQILIDLAGHTAHNRLPVFAWKPAPVQVSWLGYFASTGVPGMDYFVADPVSIPESLKEFFSETVWYMPETRLCFTPLADTTRLPLSPLPSARNGYITFGCFQRLPKLNDDVLALWGRIFKAIPDARLRVQCKQMSCPSTREHLLHRLACAGIAPERVTVTGLLPRDDYLASHAGVDIILDTFPYTGGTTTCEALWMGVPTLTLAGETLLARQGASMMGCAGLDDWVASSKDDYVARASFHASNIERLAQLRAGLRQQVLGSPLFDAPRFARNMADALQKMWQRRIV